MRARPIALATTLAALLAARGAGASQETSIRCEGGLVQVGDAKLDLLGKCGRPRLEDPRREAAPGGRGAEVVEDWTYDFGAGQFTVRVRLGRGRVVAIERGGHGYAAAPAPFAPRRAACAAGSVRVGDGKLDLLQRCGEPATKDAWVEDRAAARVDPVAGQASSATAVAVERWAYDFGPRAFVQVVTLEEGKVVLVERGGYGYAR